MFNDLRTQVGEIAVDIAGRVVGQSLDKKAHEKLIDDYIEQVARRQGPGLSRMELLDRIFGKGGQVAGYATALVAVAEAEGVLSKVEDELYAFAKAAEQNPQLREALTDQALPVDNRQALVRDILGDRAHPTTVTLISFLIESGRARDLTKIAEAVVEIAADIACARGGRDPVRGPVDRQAARAPGEGAVQGDRPHRGGQGRGGSNRGRRRDRARR